MKLKPKAYSMEHEGYKIIYKCAKCAYPFKVANDYWHFCPCCGQEIDWGVIVIANEEWKQRFLSVLDNRELRILLFDELDRINNTLNEDIRQMMKTSDATKRAITKSNITYLLNNSWTKEAIIDKGFAKEEDFDDIIKHNNS